LLAGHNTGSLRSHFIHARPSRAWTLQCVAEKKKTVDTLHFGKCRPIFNFLLPDFQENSARDYYRVFHLTLTVMLRYLANFKNL